MNITGVTETDLVFGGMDINIRRGRIRLQIENEGWIAAGRQEPLVRQANGMIDLPVADDAAVKIKILAIRLAARQVVRAQPAPQAHVGAAVVDDPGRLPETSAHHRFYPAARIVLVRPAVEYLPAVMQQPDSHVKPAQGDAPDHFQYMQKFGSLGAEKLPPRRGGMKQVAYFNRGADGVCCGNHCSSTGGGAGTDLPALFVALLPGCQLKL